MKFIMDFLRSPFQYRSAEQENRKAESGSPIVENMFIDPTTGLTTESRWKASPGIGASSSVPGSPRLQHRIPGFGNNGTRPVEVIHEPSVQQNVSSNESEKSHRVRIVPIEIENVDNRGTSKKRAGALHSNSGTIPQANQFSPVNNISEDVHKKKRHSSGPALYNKKNDAAESKPKVCNIPIFVEGRDTPIVSQTSRSSQNGPVKSTIPSPKTESATAKQNGGNLTKCSTKSKGKHDTKPDACEVSQNQISEVLSELESLKTAVYEFKGVQQDKQYRYLDEMLTRCMLKLDNVETHGDDEIRASRKAAVKAIQESINELEACALSNAKSEQPSEVADGSGEKHNALDVADTENKEADVPKEEVDMSVCENTQDANYAVKQNEENAAPEQESAGLKETALPVSAKVSEPVISGVVLSTGAECLEGTAIQKDKNCMKAEGIVHKAAESERMETAMVEIVYQKEIEATTIENVKKPVDSEGMEASTNETAHKPVDSEGMEAAVNETEDQQFNKTEEFKTSQASVGVDKAVDSAEVGTGGNHSSANSDLPSHSEAMDSDEVPETKMTSDSEMVEVKNEAMDSEMVEVAKESDSIKEDKQT